MRWATATSASAHPARAVARCEFKISLNSGSNVITFRSLLASMSMYKSPIRASDVVQRSKGELPDWAKRFAEQHSLTVKTDSIRL